MPVLGLGETVADKGACQFAVFPIPTFVGDGQPGVAAAAGGLRSSDEPRAAGVGVRDPCSMTVTCAQVWFPEHARHA